MEGPKLRREENGWGEWLTPVRFTRLKPGVNKKSLGESGARSYTGGQQNAKSIRRIVERQELDPSRGRSCQSDRKGGECSEVFPVAGKLASV